VRLKIAAAVAAIGFGFAGAAVGMDSNMSKEGDMPDPIPARQELMKMNGAAAWGVSLKMIKGENPFDKAKAADAMKIIADNMEEFPSLFPEDSIEGSETRARAAIWQNMADFEAQSEKTAEDAKAAEAAAAEGPEAFAAAFATLNDDCLACHEAYRAPGG
jgi:cytochrome c556